MNLCAFDKRLIKSVLTYLFTYFIHHQFIYLFIFQVFDKNRDGYIDEEELRLTMKDLGMSLADDDIEAMMKKAGCKIPGRIYYEGLFCSDVIELPLSCRPLGTTVTHNINGYRFSLETTIRQPSNNLKSFFIFLSYPQHCVLQNRASFIQRFNMFFHQFFMILKI